MRYLISAYANHDPENLRAGYLVRKSGIQAGATLLNRGEVEGCAIGKCLYVSGRCEVGVCFRDSRERAGGELRQGLRERCTEIGVCRAAISRVPARIN